LRGCLVALVLTIGEAGEVGRESEQLLLQSSLLASAPNDEKSLPVAYFVEELLAGQIVFAYEQFVDVVGG
jgi:hypothetical protein